MKKVSKDHKGFTVVEVLLVIFILLVICVVGYMVYHNDHNSKTTSKSTKTTTTNPYTGWQTYSDSYVASNTQVVGKQGLDRTSTQRTILI